MLIIRIYIFLIIILVVGCSAPNKNSYLLVDAIVNNDATTVNKLMKNGVNPNKKTDEGLHPIMVATGSTKIVSALYAKKPPIAVKNDTVILKLLLENGANVNFIDKIGRTPLLNAVYHGRAEAVSLLLRFRANPNHRSEAGFTPLMYARMHCATLVEKALISGGADETLKTPSGETALDISMQTLCKKIPATRNMQ